jgi:hypothetical protein
MEEEPLELVGYTLIVDDIVYPTGETRMEVLGGGGERLGARERT